MLGGVGSQFCSNILDPETESLLGGLATWLPEAIVDEGPHLLSDEIYSYLWPFYSHSEPKTLQDIGFELILQPEMMYLFVHFSSSENKRGSPEPMPNHQLARPGTPAILGDNAANPCQAVMQRRGKPEAGLEKSYAAELEAMSYV